ncbi:MAG: glycoside hydrolase family 2 [Verrucomicrobia bacterium]|nr:glycoside hydrolase family 2 [Verrucomicrobiota bacterium]
MKHLPLIITALYSLSFVPPALAAEWQPAAGPLKTRWAKDVSPAKALPEYPRPQMVRKDWLNLNGLWDIKLGDGTETRILVPFPVQSALSGVMKHTDRLTYRRSFEIPKAWSGQRVLLHFGAVDWEAKVSLNGKELGMHRGGYDAFSFDITDALKAEGAQEITVEVFDPTDLGGQPRGKQKLKPGSIMYTPVTGIWQTVWLEPVVPTHIEALRIVPDVDQGCVRIKVVAVAGKDDGNLLAGVEVYDGPAKIGSANGWAAEELVVKIPDAKLWSPESPFLYDLKVTASGQKLTPQADAVTSYFGMRKIALGKDDKGVTRMLLNGKPVFQVGPLDQGFWPDGIYTAPTDEALRFDIAETKRLGFNTTRKHVKIEPDRWYYWCDKLGLLVWQDMPCGNSYTDKPQPIDKPLFKAGLMSMVREHWNHPAIIMWVVFNENQGQHDTEALVAEVKALDPSRLVNNASGNDDKNCGDVIDKHSYPGPESPKPEANRAAVLGEFGGLGLPVDGHTWSKKTWGYEGTKNIEDLTSGYVKLLVKAWELNATAGLSAVIYTQLTDVETECNGLLTYDREVNKVIPERAAAANSGKQTNNLPSP